MAEERIDLATEVKKQHTVPRFLLSNFGKGKNARKRQLFTFDKEIERVFLQSVMGASVRRNFYNIENHPDQVSLEPILCIIEGAAAPIIKRIVKKRHIGWLTNEEREIVAIFAVMQKARSFQALCTVEDLIASISKMVTSRGYRPEDVDALLAKNNSPGLKNFFLQTLLDHIDHAQILLRKNWILYETTGRDPFYISDNPVTLHNDEDFGPFWGNLGLGVRGIQIHLPLSSTLTLAFTCPSIAERAIRAKEQLEKLARVDKTIYFKFDSPSAVLQHGEAYLTGTPMRTTSANVRFLNSLQVRFAERFVFCESDDFGLVREMLSHSEKYKTGIRPRFSQ